MPARSIGSVPRDPLVQAHSPARRHCGGRHARLGQQRVFGGRERADRAQSNATVGHTDDGRATGGCCDATHATPKPRSRDTSRCAWAKLVARVGGGVSTCVPHLRQRHQAHRIHHRSGADPEDSDTRRKPLEPPPVSPSHGPPTEWGALVQVHDDRAIFRASPDELPVIDIHSLCQTSAARRRSPGNGRLGRGLRRCDTNATAGGGAFQETGSGRPGSSSRGSRVAHQAVDRYGNAIDRAVPGNFPLASVRFFGVGP